MTNQTTTFRKRIDFLIVCALGSTVFHSRETFNALDALRMAKAWLGKALAAMGQPTPYTVADSPDRIPPTSDTSEETVPEWGSYLESVNWMREKISEINLVFPAEERQRHCYQKAQDYLEEAKMWYGFELQNMRESNAEELTLGKLHKVLEMALAKRPGFFTGAEQVGSPTVESAPEEAPTVPETAWPDPLEEQQDPLPGFAKEEFDAVAPILLDDVEKIDEGINFSGKKKGKKK